MELGFKPYWCDSRGHVLQPPSLHHLPGYSLSHIKLTNPFWCLPVSVLLAQMELAASSGSWLSSSLLTLLFLRLPESVSGRSS